MKEKDVMTCAYFKFAWEGLPVNPKDGYCWKTQTNNNRLGELFPKCSNTSTFARIAWTKTSPRIVQKKGAQSKKISTNLEGKDIMYTGIYIHRMRMQVYIYIYNLLSDDSQTWSWMHTPCNTIHLQRHEQRIYINSCLSSNGLRALQQNA